MADYVNYQVGSIEGDLVDQFRQAAKTGCVGAPVMSRGVDWTGTTSYDLMTTALPPLRKLSKTNSIIYAIAQAMSGHPSGPMPKWKQTVTVIVINGLEAPLVQTGDYRYAGCIVGVPADIVKDAAGNETPQKLKQIPGKTKIAGDVTYGIGAFRYEQDLIFYGNDRAIGLTAADPALNTEIGLTWSYALTGSNGFSMTKDVGSSYSTLKKFYEDTAAKGGMSDQTPVQVSFSNSATTKDGSGKTIYSCDIEADASLVYADGGSCFTDHMVVTLFVDKKETGTRPS